MHIYAYIYAYIYIYIYIYIRTYHVIHQYKIRHLRILRRSWLRLFWIMYPEAESSVWYSFILGSKISVVGGKCKSSLAKEYLFFFVT